MRDLFTRMEWDLIEYQIQQELWKKEHGICEEASKKESSLDSSTSTETYTVPLSALRKVNHDVQEGYVTERRAGKYIERRVCTVQQTQGSLIRKMAHVTDFEDGSVLKPYVLRSDLFHVSRLPEGSRENMVAVDKDGELWADWRSIKFMRSNTSRFANPRQVQKSCENFKWLVRANEDRVRLFVTLTYAKNMRDTRQLYQDFRAFWQRLQREVSSVEGYLVAFEPQKRGAWHAHVLLLSSKPMLYIANKHMHAIWGKGFTKTQRPKGIKDVASYLTSYLTNVKEGTRSKKGARLGMYPAGFHFLRHSKRIRYVSTRRWVGPWNKLNRCQDYELLYDYQNVRKLADGIYQVSKILCLEDTTGMIFNGSGYELSSA